MVWKPGSPNQRIRSGALDGHSFSLQMTAAPSTALGSKPGRKQILFLACTVGTQTALPGTNPEVDTGSLLLATIESPTFIC